MIMTVPENGTDMFSFILFWFRIFYPSVAPENWLVGEARVEQDLGMDQEHDFFQMVGWKNHWSAAVLMRTHTGLRYIDICFDPHPSEFCLRIGYPQIWFHHFCSHLSGLFTWGILNKTINLWTSETFSVVDPEGLPLPSRLWWSPSQENSVQLPTRLHQLPVKKRTAGNTWGGGWWFIMPTGGQPKV